MYSINYQEKLASALVRNVKITPISDGFIHNQSLYFQINLENNINRLQKALDCFGEICLLVAEEQSNLPREFKNDKITLYKLSLSKIEELMGISPPQDFSRTPFTDESGNGIYFGGRGVYA